MVVGRDGGDNLGRGWADFFEAERRTIAIPAYFSEKIAIRPPKPLTLTNRIFLFRMPVFPRGQVNCLYMSTGAWLSLVERLVRDQEVAGSNPVAPT